MPAILRAGLETEWNALFLKPSETQKHPVSLQGAETHPPQECVLPDEIRLDAINQNVLEKKMPTKEE